MREAPIEFEDERDHAYFMSHRRIDNIQRLRGVAVLLVVSYHLFRTEEKFLPNNRLLPEWLSFGASGVDLFFVISGFVMVWTTANRGVTPIDFLKRRAARIYPLYWLYSALVLAVYLIKPAWVNASQAGQFSLLRSFLLLPDDRLPLLMVGWSLVYEVYFYAVFSLLLFAKESLRPLLLWCWLAAIITGGFVRTSTGPFASLLFSPMAAEFILGCFAAFLLLGRKIPRSSAMGMLLAGILSAVLVSSFAPVETGLVLDWRRVCLFGVPAFLILFGAAGVQSTSVSSRGFLIRVGDASYSLYLCHLLVLSAGARLFTLVFPQGEPRAILLSILFAAALLCGEISYRFLERPLLDRLARGRREGGRQEVRGTSSMQIGPPSTIG